MKPSTEDEIAGKVHEVNGTIKEKVGQVTNDSDWKAQASLRTLPGKSRRTSAGLKKSLKNPSTRCFSITQPR